MIDRVLFPIDDSEGATAVRPYLFELVERHDATLHLVHVADTAHDSVTRIGGDVVDVLEREGERIVADAAERADDRQLSTVTEVLQGSVPETITAYAEQSDIDLVVLPTHGRTGLERVLVGSVTERVVRQATVPTLTVRPDESPGAHHPFRNVLVPTDGSEYADAALDVGAGLAATYPATVHVLSIVDVTSLGVDIRSEQHREVLEAQASETVDAARERAEDAAVESVVGTVQRSRAVDRGIRSYSDEHGVDLVVMGTHGRTGIDRYLLGSITEKLVRTSPVPVLAVPGPDADS